jgi:hypothetical protein
MEKGWWTFPRIIGELCLCVCILLREEWSSWRNSRWIR